MEIGAKIYYENQTGNVVLNIGELRGHVFETTKEHDFASYKILSERVPETDDVVQFEYGAYRSDYLEGGVITRIDLDTLEPLFTYPDPVDPETPQEPRLALSKQVETLMQDNTLLKGCIH
ncbi:hypothetical protein MT997_10075 [Paenibacillus sp. OVF10]|nr:hypothetical protein MT997_10075 [Paenibacillus sp. OVF10]